MIRVVLDTKHHHFDIATAPRPPAQIFVMALGGSLQMCMTGSVYAKYEEVIRRPRLKRSEETIAATLESIRHSALWVRPTQQTRACLDPDDDIFLECVQAGHADYLVTGNIKHFPISWERTEIITPRGLLDQLSTTTP